MGSLVRGVYLQFQEGPVLEGMIDQRSPYAQAVAFRGDEEAADEVLQQSDEAEGLRIRERHPCFSLGEIDVSNELLVPVQLSSTEKGMGIFRSCSPDAEQTWLILRPIGPDLKF